MISTTGLNHSSILLGNLVVNKNLSSVPIWASSASNSCLQVHLSSPQWLLPLPANVSTDSGRTVIFSNVKAGPEGQGFSSWIYWKCLTLQKVSSNLNSKRTETLVFPNGSGFQGLRGLRRVCSCDGSLLKRVCPTVHGLSICFNWETGGFGVPLCGRTHTHTKKKTNNTQPQLL